MNQRVPWSRMLAAMIVAFAGCFGNTTDAHADKQIPFAKIVDPTALTEAVDYWRGELKREDYDNERDFGYPNSPWPVTETLEDYIREYILVGRADLNDDGVDELFYLRDDTRFCGSIGCPVVVLEKRDGRWTKICGTRGHDALRITDWLTEGGGPYREMQARYRVFWQRSACHLDDPEIQEDYPPPPGRIWKPIR